MTTTPSDTKRLHITPFTPDLLPAVLPASIKALATEISFHCIPTFPENNYGYVTLPTMEADKIKKKLNGSILKGKKFKVDTARPKKRSRDEEEEVDTAPQKSSSDKKSSKKSKKLKAGEEILDGYELPKDRQVKRGWTESADSKQERRKEEKKKKKSKDEKSAKSQAKSKYTEKAECLFRTKLPPNKASADEATETKSKKKSKKSAQETVVHEFSKTVTHPSFLRSGDEQSAPTVGFEEGKGWVDEAGNVKETASDRIRSDKYRPGQVAGAKEKRKATKVVKDESSSPKKATGQKKKALEEVKSDEESEDWTSSSGESSSEEDFTDSESDQDSTGSTDESIDSSSSDDDTSVRSNRREQEEVAYESKPAVDQSASSNVNDNPPSSQTVHPLEALFKRPPPGAPEAKPETEGDAPFSFFAQDDLESEDEVEVQPTEPQTPFTKRDLQDRGLRSAAPTPDTALMGRGINWKTAGRPDPMDIDDETHLNTPVPKPAPGPKEDSDFTKWFWENRGDNNRAWKRRRREAAKEQRQRENRSKGMKGKS
ncbi:suppressor protein SRP40 [Aspergillus costaricaensis CBS 115574]|uniref:Suppressor protein SRP40 n=1 Tax=Aspergillus costaricaensis CBS 115574 TaxID=1448317 RepID=A0ACD1IL80_9EURO|nr:suppressor protein SRP40 [Aspergillus costaricaensis CBS 115574]RAK91326.1 suppressor protein SRP40 [Aspergillus costaricaensis CBS 115574]